MGQTVEANGRSILHKGHGMTHAAAPPDVCKTPSPGGPVPIPYPNFAMDSNLADGAATVKIEGNPVANVKSKISTSTGDEPGTAGGILSSVNKGTCSWKTGSPNVKAEGEAVVRFLDPTFHNGNGFNDNWVDNGGPADGYADESDEPCPLCQQERIKHGIPSRPSSAAVCAEIIRRLRDRYEENQRRTAANEAVAAANDLQAARHRLLNQLRRISGQRPQRGAPRQPPQALLTGAGNRYMVGVMVCKCDSNNLWATMSNETEPGFTEIAGDVLEAAEPLPSPRSNVVQGGPVTMQEFIGANTSAAASVLNRVRNIVAQYDQIGRAVARGTPGYTAFGICAGAKLLARSGHAPVSMTEMFFEAGEAVGSFRPTYRWRENGRVVPGGREFTAASPMVGSCNSCQQTLYLTMCPDRVCQ